jgi:threonine dehydratase
MTSLAISFDDIINAHARIGALARRTPVLTSATADRLSGAQVFFKCENFQRTGAFKFRGACNALSQFSAQQRARGVIAFSGGNHAQGIALSAQLLGMPAMIAMPHGAPACKIAATRAYGAEILMYDRYRDDREAIARRIADERGMTLIPSFDHPHVMAGQGTAVKELIEEAGALDVVVLPLGGGGLLSGGATAAKAMLPGCRVIGVEPAAGDDGRRSLQSGSLVTIAIPDTIADGAQAQHLGQHTFPVIRGLVDEIVTVDDAALVQAMRFFAAIMKIVVEPTACLGAAAVLGGENDLRGKRVGVVLTGGNVDLARYGAWLQDGDAGFSY